MKIMDVSDAIGDAIFHYCKDLKQSAQKRGVHMLDLVIHHYLGENYKEYIGAQAPKVKTEEDAQLVCHAFMINSRKCKDIAEVNDYLKKQMSVSKDKRITMEALKQVNVKLLDEVSKCVLVPNGFYGWMRRYVKIDNGKYIVGNNERYIRDRDDFYDFYQDCSRNESFTDEMINNLK